MEIFRTRKELATYLLLKKKAGLISGLVPTMGALHAGHLSLIDFARSSCDFIVCSIFVNPTQFNDAKDLDRYPRPTESDIEKLKSVNCDVLFLPDVNEMYPKTETWHIDLGNLENRLEGKVRPGHYQGVTQIVKKLFDAIEPDVAFFGQKDYQQFLVIAAMVKKLQLGVRLIMCPIVREQDGLAMSSRNIHLSSQERANAIALFKALSLAKESFVSGSIAQTEAVAIRYLSQAPGISLDYFEICDGQTLEKATSKESKALVALTAACVGNIRLIDNIILQ